MRFDALIVGDVPMVDVVPAPRKRDWFNEAAYSCTPMALANEAGWWLLNPRPFQATWDGNAGVDAIVIEGDMPIATTHFGMGIVTFHIGIIFRTEPGWSLLIQGPANEQKDGIQALQALIETDTAVETFTMNWRFTRPGAVLFMPDEPIAQITPVPTNIVDDFEPRMMPLADDAETLAGYERWMEGRNRTNLRYAEGKGKRQRNYIRHLAKRLYTPKPFRVVEPVE